jgi:site-specific recombinase XerD
MGGYRPTTRKNYNFAWKVWADYLSQAGITLQSYKTAEDAEEGFVQFLQWMAVDKKISTDLFFLLRSALSSLFHFVFKREFGTIYQAKLIAKKMRNDQPRQTRHREVFDIALLLKRYREMGANADLEHTLLRAKVGSMLILYPMLRPEDMLRLNMTQLVETEKGLHFHAVLKNRAEYTECVIARVEEEAICPVRAVMELLKRVHQHAPNEKGLFLNNDFSAPLNKYYLERDMKDLMVSAGVPSTYTPYTIKHAAITHLLRQGINDKVIGRNARLSEFANTAVRYYFVGEACQIVTKAIASAPPPTEQVDFPAAQTDIEFGTLQENAELEELVTDSDDAKETSTFDWPQHLLDLHEMQPFVWDEADSEGIQWGPSVSYDDDVDTPFSSFLHVCNFLSPSHSGRAYGTLYPSGLEGKSVKGWEHLHEGVCSSHTGSMPAAPRQAADDPNSGSLI